MEVTQSTWSSYPLLLPKEEYEDVFSFPSKFFPLDYSEGFGLNEQVGMQETLFNPLSSDQMIGLHDPFCYSSLDFDFAHNNHTLFTEVFLSNIPELGGFWDEMGIGFHDNIGQSAHQPLDIYNINLINDNDEKFRVKLDGDEIKKKGIKRSCGEEEERNSKKLTRKIISQYFYMPITQAAKELNVGLTLLKKRCRELGIRRWPHRKLMSIQTLIKNVQEFGKEEGEVKLKESLQILEQEKRLLEEIPDMQLEDKTKRLRQAFFKANYKKRKLMGMVDSSSKTGPSTAHENDQKPASISDEKYSIKFDDADEDEDFKFFFSDCF